jgi:hypothetical protein
MIADAPTENAQTNDRPRPKPKRAQIARVAGAATKSDGNEKNTEGKSTHEKWRDFLNPNLNLSVNLNLSSSSMRHCDPAMRTPNCGGTTLSGSQTEGASGAGSAAFLSPLFAGQREPSWISTENGAAREKRVFQQRNHC